MRVRPGSPWMPTPTSISFSGSAKVGLPTCGTVQEVSAMPMLRPWALTFLQRSRTCSSDWPASAAAPQIFSARMVVPTPRRPAVQVLSFTATSSSMTTLSTLSPSPRAMSAASSKFITSPV